MNDILTIGEVAARSGVATSALRFYEERGLIHSERTDSGHRRYPRAVIRRVAFIVFAQKIGLSLEEIGAELAKLPRHRVPERADWAKLSSGWTKRIQARIAELERLQAGLSECIGCGCLSLDRCRFANPGDAGGRRGPGPRFWLAATLILALGACGGRSQSTSQQAGAAGAPLTTKNMPAIAGQQKTCAGPREKTFDIDVIETTGIDLGMGTTFAAWTYNGHLPGPTIEACQGDTVTLNVHNRGTTSHGLDTHAFKIDARKYGPTAPGTTLKIEKAVETPGVFMYHCAAGPVTDIHIKSGIHGAMIVYPRDERLRPAREIVVVEDAVYGTPDEKGFIPGTDPAKTQKNDQLFSMFNGRLDNEAVRVNPGDLVRMYFVNVGPWTSAAHVIGSVFDRVFAGAPWIQGVQTFPVPAGSGAIFEFYIPEAGVFPFVDHDKLAFLPFGLALAFSTEGGAAAVH